MRAAPGSRAATGHGGWMVPAVALVLLLAPAAARAVPRPAVAGTFGGTFAVLGTPGNGGTSASLALLWPVARGVRFGAMVHADDAGTVVDSARAADGTGLSAGKVELSHRMVVGAAWRLDAETRWRSLAPFASASFGYARVVDDVRGRTLARVGSVGFGLGGGVRVPVSPHVAIGVSARYHRLFNDREGRFASAGLDFTWR